MDFGASAEPDETATGSEKKYKLKDKTEWTVAAIKLVLGLMLNISQVKQTKAQTKNTTVLLETGKCETVVIDMLSRCEGFLPLQYHVIFDECT